MPIVLYNPTHACSITSRITGPNRNTGSANSQTTAEGTRCPGRASLCVLLVGASGDRKAHDDALDLDMVSLGICPAMLRPAIPFGSAPSGWTLTCRVVGMLQSTFSGARHESVWYVLLVPREDGPAAPSDACGPMRTSSECPSEAYLAMRTSTKSAGHEVRSHTGGAIIRRPLGARPAPRGDPTPCAQIFTSSVGHRGPTPCACHHACCAQPFRR